ncbi:MAG: type II toxin-antitoxin system RelE/ParE family toxin [Tannerella sp.]|jgi:plasmid stabilization system protein ParE|nr:type II toxin-antitoxin system RelE/ParE family toxin [Tannerella sp.]
MRTVILSKRAAWKLEKLLSYLETAWSEKVRLNFIDKFDKSVKFVAQYPEATEKSAVKAGLHRCVVTKQTTFYYLFNETKIQIVTIFDTRMDPARLIEETNIILNRRI